MNYLIILIVLIILIALLHFINPVIIHVGKILFFIIFLPFIAIGCFLRGLILAIYQNTKRFFLE